MYLASRSRTVCLSGRGLRAGLKYNTREWGNRRGMFLQWVSSPTRLTLKARSFSLRGGPTGLNIGKDDNSQRLPFQYGPRCHSCHCWTLSRFDRLTDYALRKKVQPAAFNHARNNQDDKKSEERYKPLGSFAKTTKFRKDDRAPNIQR